MSLDDHQETSSKEPVPVLPRDKAKSTISTCAIIAALIGVVPIPMADAPLIIILQVVMLKKLTGYYKRDLGFALVMVLISAMIGPVLFNALSKLIPVLGSIIGAAIAGGCTWLAGETALGVLEADEPFNLASLKEAFVKIFQRWKG